MKKVVFATSLACALPFTLVTASQSCDVDYSWERIADDDIVGALRRKPKSVSNILTEIAQKYRKQPIQLLDLSNNNISVKGASNILKNLKGTAIEEIDFSNNYIYDWRGQPVFEEFEQNLIKFLESDKKRRVILKTNGIANIEWFRHMCTIAGSVAPQIVWSDS